MILLRVLGLAVAVTLLIVAAARYRRKALRLPDALITALLGAALGVISVAPTTVDPLLRQLGFPPGDARRVLGVLVLSNIVTFLLLLRAFSKTDRLEGLLGDHADRLAGRWFTHENPPASLKPQRTVAVVIPAFNEADGIEEVLTVIPDMILGMKIDRIVVSDGSDDATEDIARRHGALVAGRDLRRGQGAAVRLGYRLALQRGAVVIATLDADGQYDPLELSRLISPIERGEADVVHGSRLMGAYERPLWGRAQGLKVFAWLTTHMSGQPITDPASGFRAFSAEALKVLEFRENQFHASEVTVAATKLGLRVKEVPCSFRERRAGFTKKPPILRYGVGYARSLLRTWLS